MCRVAPRWDPHNIELEVVTETESGGFLEEVILSAAAAATFAEGAECDAAVHYRRHPAITASFSGEMSQEREGALDLEEIDVLVRLKREREEGFPRKRRGVPSSCRPRVSEHGIGWLTSPVKVDVFFPFLRQVVQGPPLLLTQQGSTPARTRVRGVKGEELVERRRPQVSRIQGAQARRQEPIRPRELHRVCRACGWGGFARRRS